MYHVTELDNIYPLETAAHSDTYTDDIYFEDFVQQIDDNGVPHIVADETFLIGLLESKMREGTYDLVINLLKQIDFTTNPIFLKIWDEVHYKIHQTSSHNNLTALQRYRIRKRNTPPSGICGGGERPNLRMSDHARVVLQDWYNQHGQDPYPSRLMKVELSELAGITVAQVNTWFANARRRGRKLGKQFQIRADNNAETAKLETTTKPQNDVRLVPDSKYHKPVTVTVPRERASLFGNTTTGDRRKFRASKGSWSCSYNTPATVCTPAREPCAVGCVEETRDLLRHRFQERCPFETMNGQTPIRHRYQVGQLQSCAHQGNIMLKRQLSNNKIFQRKQIDCCTLQRLRSKLTKCRPSHQLRCSECCVTPLNSLTSLQQLCDRIDTVVESPIDFANSVDFSECNFRDDTTYTTYTDTTVQDHASYTGIINPVQDMAYQANTGVTLVSPPFTKWTQIMDSTTFDNNRVHEANVLSEEDLSSISALGAVPRQMFGAFPTMNVDSHDGQSTIGLCDQGFRPITANESDRVYISSTTAAVDSDKLERQTYEQTCFDSLDTSQLEGSYGTVVGEAIQGLLNLSAQNSDITWDV